MLLSKKKELKYADFIVNCSMSPDIHGNPCESLAVWVNQLIQAHGGFQFILKALFLCFILLVIILMILRWV